MTDRRTVQTVVCLLGALGLLLAGGLLASVLLTKDVPDAVLTLLGSNLGAVVGALGALLAHTSTWPADSAQVQVTSTTSVDGDTKSDV